ncbi:hypothetical protein HY486_00555 [Candidatus Woesearchaeota archaeon]|nr:hypothetical protein [Candidatus Woesearchaeota archaeon]
MVNKLLVIAVIAVIVMAVFVLFEFKRNSPENAPLDDFAQCLTSKGVKMYGAFWCGHCNVQKEMFGESFKHINYVECATSSGQTPACIDAKINAYPTWEVNGKRTEGEMSLASLSQSSGCTLPE